MNASIEEIESAAKLASAHEFIQELPDKYKYLCNNLPIKNKDSMENAIMNCKVDGVDLFTYLYIQNHNYN
jgi:hypothetical protein